MANIGLLVVLCSIIFSSDYVRSEIITIAAGRELDFISKVEGHIETFDWRHNGNLVVELENGKIKWYRYQARGNIDSQTGKLKLRVQKGDDGEFKGQFEVKGALSYSSYNIKVMEPVSFPQVSCSINSTFKTLTCSENAQVSTSLTWKGPNGFSQSGNVVHIPVNQREDSVYYCTVKNEVSEETVEFTLKDCRKAEESKIGIIVGSVVGVVLLAVVGALVFLFRNVIKAKLFSSAGYETRDDMRTMSGGNSNELCATNASEKQNGADATLLNQGDNRPAQ